MTILSTLRSTVARISGETAQDDLIELTAEEARLVIGGMPARWAVASCPGMVTAPNVTPASRSRPSHRRR